MKNGLSRKVFVDGAHTPVLLDVWDVKTNKVVHTGVAKSAAKFIGCKLSNINSANRSGSTIQKKYKIKYTSEKAKHDSSI